MKILVINGVNMNMLGFREPEKYGCMTLKNLEDELKNFAVSVNIILDTWQSNIEGEIVEKIHASQNIYDGIVLNAGAYTHTSVAIRDAISAVCAKVVEIHMTNIYAREDFRHTSLIAPVCIGQISGFGIESYKLGIKAVADYLASSK